MNPPDKVALDTPLVTVTSATNAPLTYAGVIAVIVVESTMTIPVAVILPIVTVELRVNPVPVRVIVVPPAVDPDAGEMEFKVGAIGV